MGTFKERIGVGILGAGRPNIATGEHIPACETSRRVRLVALCDRLPEVHDYARSHGVRGYTDFAEMLADPAVEMVQVATPDWCHCEHALQSLAAGKAVLLQKPPCVTRDELAQLRRAATAHPGMLKICLNTRESLRARRLREWIDGGVIGKLVHIRISYRGRRFPIEDLGSPYLTAALGGVWLHNGMHWLDEACFYANALPTRVQLFAARNDKGPAELLGEGPNYWSALFDLGDAATFRLEYNTMLMAEGLPGGMQRVLIGTGGEIRQPYGSEEIRIYRAGRDEPACEVVCADAAAARADVLSSFVRVVDAFAEQLVDGHERAPAAEHSLACMEWLLQGAESGRTLRAGVAQGG